MRSTRRIGSASSTPGWRPDAHTHHGLEGNTDVPSVSCVANRSHTDINVPACDMDLPYVQYRDLFVYTNKLYGGTVESDRERMENVRTPASHSSSVQRHLGAFYRNSTRRT